MYAGKATFKNERINCTMKEICQTRGYVTLSGRIRDPRAGAVLATQLSRPGTGWWIKTWLSSNKATELLYGKKADST